MKKFENLGKSLSKTEQKKITGGFQEGGEMHTGYCEGSVGCWHYITPVSAFVCGMDILIYCRSGSGTCNASDSCPN